MKKQQIWEIIHIVIMTAFLKRIQVIHLTKKDHIIIIKNIAMEVIIKIKQFISKNNKIQMIMIKKIAIIIRDTISLCFVKLECDFF